MKRKKAQPSCCGGRYRFWPGIRTIPRKEYYIFGFSCQGICVRLRSQLFLIQRLRSGQSLKRGRGKERERKKQRWVGMRGKKIERRGKKVGRREKEKEEAGMRGKEKETEKRVKGGRRERKRRSKCL
jgi:hypothetical protein